MADVEFREPQDGDAEALLANLRPADLLEVEALSGKGSVPEILRYGFEQSLYCWTVTVNGEVACVIGVAPTALLAGEGVPWMLGTPLVDRYRSALMRRAPSYIARMLAVFPHLCNVVDARNVRAIAWLRHMGFEVHDAIPVGRNGEPFHPFTLDA